ncbi:MAG: PDZ domain-containing protein [Acetobacteraceae bacterium]
MASRLKIARVAVALVCVCLAGCAIERAQEATEAQKSMVGMSKEQVLACMGSPANSAEVGDTEVWTYNSGNGRTDTFGSVNMIGTPQPVIGGYVSPGPMFGTMSATTTSRFCTVDIVMRGERVSRINYSGPTGGLLTKGEQCAFAVDNCARELAASNAAMSHGPMRPLFGVTIDTTNILPQGLPVIAIAPGEVGDRAGIEAGDIILAYGGKPMNMPRNLQAAVDATKVGDTKAIELLRNGEKITVRATF